MCIGTLGEAYANFGRDGGIFMMLILGCILNKLFAGFVNLGKFNGYFLLCLPLIFLQAIKSETELIVVINHLVKSIAVVLLLYLILPRAFGTKGTSKQRKLKRRRAKQIWRPEISPVAMAKQ